MYLIYRQHVKKLVYQETLSIVDIDIRNYAKFILQEGNIDEKREFFRCLNSDILLKDKVISLE